MADKSTKRTATHWGVYDVETRAETIVSVRPWPLDPDPSPLGQSLDAIDGPTRVQRPAVRKSWLEGGPGQGRRGGEAFVEVDWDKALDLVASELKRVRREHGNKAIYAGSYGWASAGRFHHAQSQIHRFMSAIGGYTRSVNSYSLAAAEVIVPHVVGHRYGDIQLGSTSLNVVAESTDLMVCFGGIPLKNAQVQNGGQGQHRIRDLLLQARDNGCRFVNISPMASDIDRALDAQWLAPRPNSDTAIMLGLAHTLVTEGLHDPAFLAHYCVGAEPFLAYLTGESDGVPKDADWAAAISGLDSEDLRHLSRQMAASRTMLNVSWSLQRAEHGEQTFWMVIVLAALLGQIGQPGGGFTLGYGTVGSVGNGAVRFKQPTLPPLPNPVDSYIPVARIADMLEKPGQSYSYNGERRRYPDARLVYWAGGNPFHHHQDLNRLVEAWQKPETVIVNEPFWTSTARHADIVLPTTTPLERNDLSGSSADDFLVLMEQALSPRGEARNDYDIFCGLAERLGVLERFSEGRNEAQWLETIYERFRQQSNELPAYEQFRSKGYLQFGTGSAGQVRRILFEDFRRDPQVHPLPTPSGRIEIWSERIDGFGLADCPPHPTWLPGEEWLGAERAGSFPLHLLTHQPATRLHSQLDAGSHSRAHKIREREAVLVNPRDAEARGISEGDIVRLFNDRGACLAGARLTTDIRPGVVCLPTGAWYDPEIPGQAGSLDKHGNPNVLTHDRGTSGLAQGSSAQSCLVELERYEAEAPPVTAFVPPPGTE